MQQQQQDAFGDVAQAGLCGAGQPCALSLTNQCCLQAQFNLLDRIVDALRWNERSRCSFGSTCLLAKIFPCAGRIVRSRLNRLWASIGNKPGWRAIREPGLLARPTFRIGRALRGSKSVNPGKNGKRAWCSRQSDQTACIAGGTRG
jgi:hypothetical protein